LQEGGNINKSLTTLGLCIKALAERGPEGSGKTKVRCLPSHAAVRRWQICQMATVAPLTITQTLRRLCRGAAGNIYSLSQLRADVAVEGFTGRQLVHYDGGGHLAGRH